jgi:hypothetical protein
MSLSQGVHGAQASSLSFGLKSLAKLAEIASVSNLFFFFLTFNALINEDGFSFAAKYSVGSLRGRAISLMKEKDTKEFSKLKRNRLS